MTRPILSIVSAFGQRVDFMDSGEYALENTDLSVPSLKGGGVWHSSPVSDGRRLMYSALSNVVDTIDIRVFGENPDLYARNMRRVRNILKDAEAYWTTSWSDNIVWLEARTICETETRYSIIYSGSIVSDPNFWNQPFLQPGLNRVSESMSLVIEHGPWLSQRPGTEKQVPIASYGRNRLPGCIYLNSREGNSYMTVSAGVNVDDLFFNEGMFDISVSIEEDIQSDVTIISKGVWELKLRPDGTLDMYIYGAGPSTNDDNAQFSSYAKAISFDGDWHQISVQRTASGQPLTIYVNGVNVTSTQTIINDPIDADGAYDLIVGNSQEFDSQFFGCIGWLRFSDSAFYGDSFLINGPCLPPAVLFFTLVQYNFWENTGTVADNNEGTAAFDGTLVNTSWREIESCSSATEDNPVNVVTWDMNNNFHVNGTNNAQIADLPNGIGSSTFEGYFSAVDPPVGLNNFYLFDKEQFSIFVTQTGSIVANFTGSGPGNDGVAISNPGWFPFGEDGLDSDTMHHIAVIFGTTLAGGFPRIWVDGIEVGYTFTSGFSRTWDSDAAFDLIVGSNQATDSPWEGRIGWVRVSSIVRYTSDFPYLHHPCQYPEIDGFTAAQWNMEEGGGVNIDNAEGNSAVDATLISGDWTTARCVELEPAKEWLYGNVDGYGLFDYISNGEVFVSNKYHTQNITGFNNDAGASPNMWMGLEFPFDITDGGNNVYFGIVEDFSDEITPLGPFNSIVFDITRAGAGNPGGGLWQYWNGAWTNLNAFDLRDETDNFTETGVRIVSWRIPNDWATTTVGTDTLNGWWVRYNPAGTFSTDAQQNNRPLYTVAWGFTETEPNSILGDVGAWLRMSAKKKTETVLVSPIEERIIIARRTRSRGFSFNAFLNASDVNNPFGVTCVLDTLFGDSVFVDNVMAPTGRMVEYTSPGPTTRNLLTMNIASGTAAQYTGKYRIFMRAIPVSYIGEEDGDFIVTCVNNGQTINIVAPGGSGFLDDSPILYDFGVVTLGNRGNLFDTESDIDIEFNITGNANTTGETFNVYDVVIMPVDEWLVQLDGDEAFGDATITDELFMDLDAVNYSFNDVVAYTRVVDTASINGSYVVSSPSKPTYTPNEISRIWFLHMNTGEAGIIQSHCGRIIELESTTNEVFLSLIGDGQI